MTLVPSYQTIGIASTIIILLLRLLQGLAFSGELPTIMVMLYEIAPDNKKATYNSFWDVASNAGLVIGICVITILYAVLSVEQIHEWGWRICFGISIFFILTVGYIRINAIETKPQNESYSFSVLRCHWKKIISMMLYLFSLNFLYYTIMLFNKFSILKNKEIELSEFQASLIHFFVVLFFVIMLPIMGSISDRFGMKKTSKITLLLLLLTAIPLYYCLTFGSLFFVILSCAIMTLGLAALAASYAPLFLKTCPVEHRVSILGIAFSLSVLIGSFTPSINHTLSLLLNSQMAPVIYFIVSLITSYMILNHGKLKL